MKRIVILGSTGSVGTNTLDIIAHHPDRFQVTALTAGRNMELLAEQARRFHPRLVCVSDQALAEEIRRHIPSDIEVAYGENGLIRAASHEDADFVVTAILGSRGLKPTLAAIEHGKTIGLANKETLVTAGHIVTRLAAAKGVRLLPIDSEHSAIFQCLNGEDPRHVRKLILTSSGGSFRDLRRDQLTAVTVQDALKHPTWSMGAKITIDSATMMNKGLEVIEARWLFAMPYDRIEVLIHPQSIVHSMVEFTDRSILSQMGTPDMRVPIQYALTYPERADNPSSPLDFATVGELHFRPMDYERFPMLRLAFECGRREGTYPTVLNAANEVAVDYFLKGHISFLAIEEVVAAVIEKHQSSSDPSLEQILIADEWAREAAVREIQWLNNR